MNMVKTISLSGYGFARMQYLRTKQLGISNVNGKLNASYLYFY